jgi:hypothetical protein
LILLIKATRTVLFPPFIGIKNLIQFVVYKNFLEI